MVEDRCDIVIPVFNALNYVTACIDSIIKYTDYPYRIIVVDDASDNFVRQKLGQLAKEHHSLKIIYNDQNLGFIKTVNRGVKESSGKYVVILNSDTYVTSGWLSRMIKCAESDSRIGVVNPITNMAVNLSVQMPPGFNIFTMNEKISDISRRAYPDIVTAVGFCFMVKRELIDKIGSFDEIYGMGYCEESDYCMKTVDAGYRVVAADDAFVYHKGCTSFGTWLDRYYKNRKIFDSRWASLYDSLYKNFLKKDTFGYLRSALTADLKIASLGTAPIKELGGMTVSAWKRSGVKGLLRKLPAIPSRIMKTLKGIAKQIRSEMVPFEDPAAKQNFVVTAPYMARLPKGKGLKIAFLVHEFVMSGGVVSILQLANEFILNGNTAYIVTLSQEPEPARFNMYTRPMRFKNETEMVDYFPDVDIVVATYWPTAYNLMPKIKAKRPNLKSVYFVQDFESWFYPEREEKKRRMILDSYNRCDYRIVKSSWLQNKLRELGHESHKIHLGLDLEVFYPRDTKRNTDQKRIVLQVRPFEKRRGFENALGVFKLLNSKRNDIEAVFFGCKNEDLRSFDMPFRYANAGIMYDLNETARLYCSCDLLVDPSLFQGFGRPGIEAMACGVPTVLTKEGGVHEYAQDGINTLLVDPVDINQMAQAIIRVLDDEYLRRRLIDNGLNAAHNFSYKDEARLHLEFYNEILEKQ